MRALVLILALIPLLAACGRPLTTNERAFLDTLHGDTLDTAPIRINNGLAAGSFTYNRPARPRLTCTERVFPPPKTGLVEVAPGAMAGARTVYVRKDLYLDDFLHGAPRYMNLYAAMLFAHEMTHIWQWQNRKLTKYHPLKGAGEHVGNADPYLFDPATSVRFLDHGYEQQGAIVEEYVCCRALAPEAPRTKRLHKMLAEVMDVAPLDPRTSGPQTHIPWKGVVTRGICD